MRHGSCFCIVVSENNINGCELTNLYWEYIYLMSKEYSKVFTTIAKTCKVLMMPTQMLL